MSDEENGFLQRWARRKAEARQAQCAPEEQPAPLPESEPEPDEVEFDISSLPPLESLGAASDYTAFLKAGVPKALRRAAFRKAWASDPAITGHKPLVDYDWDCNAPGYGALRPGDNPQKLVEALFRHLRETPQPEEEGAPETPATEIARSDEALPASGEDSENPDLAPAVQTEEAPAPAHPREPEKSDARMRSRTHGGAVPS